MHVVIINGSPRVQKYSNTDKIIHSFARGLTKEGVTNERYAISDRNSWDKIRMAYERNTRIVIALPLYVECVPGLFLEFLDILPRKNKDTQISFILQGGFAEGSQFRCGEEFLKNLPEYLGCSYGGCLVKGDNFSIRFADEMRRAKMTEPYEKMGSLFAKKSNFHNQESRAFTGEEYFSLPKRMMLGFFFKTVIKKAFQEIAVKLGCQQALDVKPYYN